MPRGEHAPGRERGGGRAEQVDIQLAVRKLAADAVGGVDDQGGLAEAAGTGHHRDAHRAGIAARSRAPTWSRSHSRFTCSSRPVKSVTSAGS